MLFFDLSGLNQFLITILKNLEFTEQVQVCLESIFVVVLWICQKLFYDLLFSLKLSICEMLNGEVWRL